MYAEHGSWIKVFKDGTKEHGSDLEIQEKIASWSRGRLDNISEVLLADGLRSVSLSVPDTNWHQFDRYIAPIAIGSNSPVRTHRVIQAEIKECHVGRYVVGACTNSFFSWAVVEDEIHSGYDYNQLIRSDDVGKWITVVLGLHKPTVIKFSFRGKV